MIFDLWNYLLRLLDYEKITRDNKRLVAFGRYAGLAGMLDYLSGLGLFMLQRQKINPLV